MSFTVLQIPTFSDDRGNLTVLERVLPFNIARLYWIYGADYKTRGGHRHHRTRQALISMHGKVSIYMNDGHQQETIELTHPSSCLIVEPKDWHTMTFARDSMLLVLSSELYNKDDYIDIPYENTLK